MGIPTHVKVFWNSGLLVVCLFLLSAYALIQFDPGRIDRAGIAFTEKYEAFYAGSQTEAMEALGRGEAALALEWLDDQSRTLRGDRLYPMKRELRMALLDRLDASGQHAEMMLHAQAWQAEGTRDISARAYFLGALAHSPGHEQEAEALLEIEARRFPKNAAFARFLAQTERPWTSGWILFWDLGSGFSATHRSPAISIDYYSDREWRITTTIPGRLRRLRIDPPSGARLAISKISLHSGDWKAQVDPKEVRLNAMREDLGTLLAVGEEDPHFYFALSDLPAEATEEIALEIRLDIVFPNAPTKSATK